MGGDAAALLRLWREKRARPSRRTCPANLIVQLGLATERVNRQWYERATRQVVKAKLGAPPGDPLDGGDAGRVRRHNFITT